MGAEPTWGRKPLVCCSKYGGLGVSEAKRLKALEDENGRMKRLLAEAMLDNAVLKHLSAKEF